MRITSRWSVTFGLWSLVDIRVKKIFVIILYFAMQSV